MDIKKLETVPNKPGVYLWKDSFDNVIYVGKAKNLNARMNQYFKGMLNSYKTKKLVEMISSFDYVITATEKEALILERNLITKHAPIYNIKLTDDKRYPYIKVQLKDTLKISLIYRVTKPGEKTIIYGPFPTGFGAKRMVNLLNRLSTYKDGLPNTTIDKEFWEEKYVYIKKILSSGSSKLIKELKVKMIEAAESEKFEIAHDIKESVKALEFYSVNQNVQLNSNEDIDVMGIVEKDGFLSISLLFYRQGNLLSKLEKILEITSSKEETLRQFVSQYYAINFVPNYILSNEFFESEIKLVIPEKGTKKNVLNLALENANNNIELKMSEFVRKEELTIGAISKLEALLNIESAKHILMIDNSNTNNTNPVSAIVSYRNGIKQKHEYKKYNLEVGTRLADVDYMKQGVTKHFEKQSNKAPDLFIVDGGLAQVNEVSVLLPNIKVIGLVKNNKHKTEAIIDTDGTRLEIEDNILLNFLSGIQVEVDRFAKYHHTVRRRRVLEGVLSSINGIGDVAERKLLEHFKTYSAIYNASIEELSKVVSKSQAESIKKEFN